MSCKSRCLAAVVVVVILVACGTLVALPCALYFSKTSKDSTINQFSIPGNCPKPTYNDTGSTCYSVIKYYQQCLSVNGSNETYVDQLVNTIDTDITLALILGLLKPSANCRRTLYPFLCLYQFPLCDEAGAITYPTAELCEEISTTVCKEEWDTAAAIGTTGLLPQCQSLPSESPYISRKCLDDLVNISVHIVVPLYNGTVQMQCDEDFFLYNGTCRPRCDSWETTNGVRLKITCIVTGAIGFVAEMIFLAAIIVKRKKMFTFPKVLIVYITINITVLTALLLFVNYSDRSVLFCSSPDLISSIQHPTAFCSFLGAVFIYENLNLSLIWICHVSFMFVKLTFPFHARSLEAFGYKKCILAVFLVVSLLVPIVPVATIFGTNGFAMVTFPPFFCFPKNGDATYYSLTLPITVILAIGTAMLVIIIWNVHKHHGLLRERQNVGVKKSALPPISDAERKLILSFLYYIFVGVIATVSMSISLKNAINIRLKFEEYFLCIGAGTVPDNICQPLKDEADHFLTTELIAIAFALITLFPITHVFYVGTFSYLFRRQNGKLFQLGSSKTTKVDTRV